MKNSLTYDALRSNSQRKADIKTRQVLLIRIWQSLKATVQPIKSKQEELPRPNLMRWMG